MILAGLNSEQSTSLRVGMQYSVCGLALGIPGFFPHSKTIDASMHPSERFLIRCYDYTGIFSTVK